MREKNTVTTLIQEAIDKGATTAEEIHKSIAELPLKMLEESDLLRRPAKEVRRVQDRAIGAVYDLVRDINQKIGTFASDLLAEAGGRRVGQGGAEARKRSTRHAAH
jgi:histone H3/H4